jgi:hypothetical protein
MAREKEKCSTELRAAARQNRKMATALLQVLVAESFQCCGSVIYWYEFGRPKNIRIWIRMRIRNTGTLTCQKTVEIKVFLIFFCLMMEGSGAGSVLVTYGSGRSENIRIRNSGFFFSEGRRSTNELRKYQIRKLPELHNLLDLRTLRNCRKY